MTGSPLLSVVYDCRDPSGSLLALDKDISATDTTAYDISVNDLTVADLKESMIRMRPEPAPPLTEPTYCILAALAEPRHGYAIMHWVGEVTGQRVKLGPGTLYGALMSLQDRGFIAPMGEGLEGHERRKVYGLTERGRTLLEAETTRLESMARVGRKALEN